MDTVLNLGLNEETLQGLIDLDRQRALRLGRLPPLHPDVRADRPGRRAASASTTPSTPPRKRARGASAGHGPRRGRPARGRGRGLQGDRPRATPDATSPRTPTSSSTWPSRPSSRRWFGKRARDYRENQKIAHDLGTAVNVVTMVFGNMGDDSGTGVAFTRDPNTGEKVALRRVPDQRAGRGRRGRHPDAPDDRPDAPIDMPEVYDEFQRIGAAARAALPRRPGPRVHDRARPALHAPDARPRKRTAAAAVKIAVDMVEEGIITEERRSRGSSRPGRPAPARPVRPEGAQGRRRASPRASTPRPARPSDARCSTPTSRSSGSSAGEKVILVRVETSPDDFHGMAVAEGILTARGGATSPRRGRRPPDRQALRRRLRRAGRRLRHQAAAQSTSDGHHLRRGRLDQPRRHDRARSSSARCRRSRPASRTSPSSRQILGWADEIRRMEVWTNADKPEEAAQARSYGAQGIGLCRTEHMFREGERLEIVRGAILVANVATRAKAEGRRRRGADRRGDRGARHVRRGDGQARGPPAGRLRGHLRGDGRPAGRHPADRPAAPRVPARTSRSSWSR